MSDLKFNKLWLNWSWDEIVDDLGEDDRYRYGAYF